MSNDQPQTPTLPGVIDGGITARLKNVRVALPGRIETYDPTTQTCSVQPLVYEGYFDETGTRQAERLPVVASVPVAFPSGGGTSITLPIKAGDTVLLVFASSSIDRWLALGGEVDPIDDRRHHLTDAIAIPGLRSLAAPLASTAYDASAMVLAGALKLGTSLAVDAALKGDSFLSAFSTLIGAIATAAATPATATTAINSALATFVAAAASYKSAFVKVG